jgi:predicted 3-demethylubiquinone-9 3-methyltransferase (glyoxalase superfamily)
MQKITPFLWFDEQAEEAVNLYTSIFQNSKIHSTNRIPGDVPGPKDKVMTINFQLAGLDFIALNGGPEFQFSPAISFYVYCQTEQELDALWARLVENGFVFMALDKYPFAEKFGWLSDRYGVSWQLMLTHQPQQIVPCLLFTREVAGRAEEAIHLYTSVFKNSQISGIEYYPKDAGEPQGSVLHGAFTLAGQDFVAFDSSAGHQFGFTHATSFMVHCQDQAEVDRYWDALAAGGEVEQCGWLKDRFGVSWQIVPDVLFELMSDPDPVKAQRVTQAMLKMVKLDIGQLKAARG